MAAANVGDEITDRLEELTLGENVREIDHNGGAAQQIAIARVNQLLIELADFIGSLILPVHRVTDAGNRRERFGVLYKLVDELIRNGATLKSDSNNLSITVKSLGLMKPWKLILAAPKEKLENILNWLDVDRDLHKAVFRNGGVPAGVEANNKLPITLLQVAFDNENNILSRDATARDMESPEDGIYGYICRQCPLGQKEKVCFISSNEFKERNSFKNHYTANKSKCNRGIARLGQGEPLDPFICHVVQHFLDPELDQPRPIYCTPENAFAWTYVAVALPTGTSMRGNGNNERIRSSWEVFWKWVTRARRVRGGFNEGR